MRKLIFVLMVVVLASCSSKLDKIDDGSAGAVGSKNISLTISEHNVDSATLEWQYKGPDPYCFRILKRIDSLWNPNAPSGLEKYAVIAKLDSGVRKFVDESINGNSTLGYKIRTCREESLDGGNYSNGATSSYPSGFSAPTLKPPVMVGEKVEINWTSKAAFIGEVTLFNIYRKTNVLDDLGTPIVSVNGVLGVDKYSYIDENCPRNGYFIYVIEAIGDKGTSISEQIGLNTGVVDPGIITDFSAIYLSPSDSISSMNSDSPNDVILEWRYTGSPCIFVFKMKSGDRVSDLKDFSSTNNKIKSSFNSFIARVPYSQIQDWIENGVTAITFEVYAMTSYAGNVVTTTLDITKAANLNAGASSISASGSGENLKLVLEHNYKINGFITSYGVQRRDCGTSFSSCDLCASPVDVLSRRKFITSLTGVKPSFSEYFGSSALNLQRQEGHEYCYSFVLGNGYEVSSTPWSHH